MRTCITWLVLLFVVGPSACNAQRLAAVQNPKTAVRNPSKPVDCAAPNGYSVAETLKAEARYVDIKQGDMVLGSIRIFSDAERNGFALDEAKTTKTGFEISVEYGSRYFYHKRFVFICKQHRFYLTRVFVDSFDKHNPEHWSKKAMRVRPALPLERFLLDDFMLEGVVKQRRGRTTHWTGAAGACFASSLVRRRLNEFAPPGQL
jgi:hypothetical protein